MIIKPSSRLSEVATYYFATKLAQIEQMNHTGRRVLNLGVGSPDLEPPADVIEVLKENIGHTGINGYQSYRGIPELRNAFAAWYLHCYNTKLDPESEFLPLIGSKEGIMHISMSFLDKGDKVLVPDPGYPAYKMTTLLAGAEPISYDLLEKNNWLPDLEVLREQDLEKVKIMWINYPHMPSGARATLSVFEELISFAKDNNLLICHDNPYGFILNENPISILQIDGAKDVAVELNSLSKSFNMAGWRVGVLCGKSNYINTVMKFKSNMDSGMYKPIQLAAVKAMNSEEQWYSRLNTIYRKRRKIVWKIMDLLNCAYNPESAGMFVWGRVPDEVSDVAQWTDEILLETGVFITPGIIFGNNGERYIRISLCNDGDVFKQAFSRLEKQFSLLKN